MLHSSKKAGLSNYNFGLFGNRLSNEGLKYFFSQKLKDFSDAFGYNSNELFEIDFSEVFTDIDFNKKIPENSEESFVNKFVYPIIFRDLKPNRDKLNRKQIVHKLKYAFTIDLDLANQKIETKNGIVYYKEFFLGKKVVFYFIGLPVQELIRELKN